MTDRLAELGALQYAVENLSTAGTNPNRLGLAGYIHAAYTDYQTWAAANPGVNPNRLSARGRLYGYFYDNGDPDAAIKALFANSEVGAWYDPSDLTTMFQDRAGTAPVTADGQTVGLILDKSKGLVLGSEIIASPYSGSVGGLWTIDSSGVHRNGSTSSNALITLNLVPSVGWYKISFVVSNFSGDSFTLNYPGGNIGQISANGTYERIVYVTSSASTFSFIPWGGFAGQADISSISYKTLAGNHATAPSDAARPLYKTDGTYHWLQFDGVDDSLSTAAIDFTSTDKMNVFTGIKRVLNTAGRKTIVMFMGDPHSVNGSFELNSPNDGSDASIGVRGTQRSGQLFPLVASLNVLTAKYDLRGNSYVTCTELRQNGISLNPVVAQSSSTAGTGNFGNGSLSVAKIINQSAWFGGNIYSLIVRGVLSTTQEITDTETWVNSKTGAF